LGGGAEAVIEDGLNGLLVDIDDVDAEVAALTRLVDDSTFANAVSREAAKLRDALSLDKIGDKWLGLLRSTL